MKLDLMYYNTQVGYYNTSSGSNNIYYRLGYTWFSYYSSFWGGATS